MHLIVGGWVIDFHARGARRQPQRVQAHKHLLRAQVSQHKTGSVAGLEPGSKIANNAGVRME